MWYMLAAMAAVAIIVARYLLEPYAMKVARTVLRGGKSERTYLSQLFNSMIHEKSYHNLNRINLSNWSAHLARISKRLITWTYP